MRKSVLYIGDLNLKLSNEKFNYNFDFINQNYNNLFDSNPNFYKNKYEEYVKVKYLKGKR